MHDDANVDIYIYAFIIGRKRKHWVSTYTYDWRDCACTGT